MKPRTRHKLQCWISISHRMARTTIGEEPPALPAAFARVMSASIRGMAAAWGGRGGGMGEHVQRGERGIGLLPG